MKRYQQSVIESLEGRTFFSGAVQVVPPDRALHAVVKPAAIVGTAAGFTLHLTAGVPFSGVVAFYSTPVLDPPDGYFASINWGDGTVTQGTLGYGMHGSDFGENVTGTHDYAKAGTYKIVTTFEIGPRATPGKNLTVLDRIVSKAIVVARPANSVGGVTIDETAGVKFTAVVASFQFPAPATHLAATIEWGDGTTSAGTLVADGVIGIDVLKFKVKGTHTYTLAGTYPIKIVVTRPAPTASSPTATSIITTIESTAIVLLSPPISALT